MEAYEETRLIRSAASGDEQAYEKLYRRYVNEIYALSLRMVGNPDLAEDITQDIFVLVWKKIGGFRGRSAFRTWLYRVALNAIFRFRRRLSKQSHLPYSQESHPDPADAESRTDLRLDLEKAISTLPIRARTVFILHDIKGFRHNEAANILGISQGTSKAHLHRARELLRKELER